MDIDYIVKNKRPFVLCMTTQTLIDNLTSVVVYLLFDSRKNFMTARSPNFACTNTTH